MSIYKYLKHHYFLIICLLTVGVTAALLEGLGISLVFPILQGTSVSTTSIPFPFNVISDFFMGMDLKQKLQIVAGLILLITLIKSVFVYLSVILTSRLQLFITKYTRMECAKQIMRVGMKYFNRKRSSDLQLIIDAYTNSAAGAIVGLIGTALPQLFTSLLMVILLFMLSWKLTLVAIVLVLIASITMSRLSQKTMIAAKRVISTGFDFNRIIFDILNGMKIIRLFNRESLIISKFERKVDAYNNAFFEVINLTGIIGPLFEVIGIAILSSILFVGSYFIQNESGVGLGVLLTFLIILTRIIAPVKALNQTRATIISKLPALYELSNFLATNDKEYLSEGALKFNGLKNEIEYASVVFSYASSSSVVLKNINIQIKKGTKVGIVGPSGSGKSTISELLLRFYDPQKGKIMIDGSDLKELDIYLWRKHIGVVSQDTFLFNDTVKANIAFPKDGATQQEIKLAAERAHAHEFIVALPNGYDTFIGDRGVLLSGGERQRLAIARAILSEPEILIFDEATSSLDTKSEKIVQEALDEIGKGKTVLTIAHRLSTIADSDKIIVIDKGSIVEAGTHQELLCKGGLYNKLVKMQTLETQANKKGTYEHITS